MKKITSVAFFSFVILACSLNAHPLGFKVVCYNNAQDFIIDRTDQEYKDSLLLYESGIDYIYTFRESVYDWCKDNNNTTGNRKIGYMIDCPGTDGALGGYSGSWRFYSTGYGMIGRYTQWRLCEDSMAIWETLASMCIDSLEKYHANIGNPTGYEPGFGMYRLMDGDSGYTSGMGKNHAFVGLQLLYNRLDDDYAFTGGNSTAKTHYSYLWGSYDFPYSVDYYLDKAPDLDVVGPGAYIFSSNDNSVVQEGLDSIISRCRRYVRPINARGKVYMPLVQCGIIFSSGCRPTLKQLRAASWVVLTHGSAWLGYYYYRGWSSVYPGVVDGTRRPYVMNYGDLNTALNTNIWDDENTNIADNGWLNLYTVIKEIKQIGPTLGNLTWVDGFGKKSSTTELPRGWVKAATGANRIEFGMFTHDESGEQYLMVVNCDCAESDDGVKDITLTLTPGPGTYSIKNVATDQTIYSNSTNSNGELTNVLIEDVPAGGGVLLQLQRTSKTEDITSDDLFATEGSNGRHIVADDFGGLHVVYISNGNVYYAYKNSGEATLSGWSKQLVVTGANYSSLALDDYGNPYIAYHKSNKTYVTNLVKTLEVGFGNSSGPTSIAVNSECRSFCVGAVYGGEVIFGMFDWITFQRLGYYMDLGPGSYPTVTSGTVEVKNSPYHGKPCYFVAKESKGKITVNSFLADGSSCWIGSFITFNGSLPSYDWDGQTSVLIYVDGSTAKCRRGSNNYATAETVGNNGGYIQSDKGLFAAWKNHPIHGIEGAYFKDGTWTQDNILASSYGLNSINTAISWYHKKAYVFAAVNESNPDANYLWIYGTTTNGMGFDGARVIQPNGSPNLPSGYLVGKPITVKWSCLSTADSPDHFTVQATYNYEDYPNCSWQTVDASSSKKDLQGFWTCTWTPTKAGVHCRVKVTVDYGGGNTASDVSDYDFAVLQLLIIKSISWLEGQSKTYQQAGDEQLISWLGESAGGLDTVVMQLSRNGGEDFVSVAGSAPYDSTQTDTIIDDTDTSFVYSYEGGVNFTIPLTPVSDACLRLMVTDTLGDTAYSEQFFPFAVAPPGGFKSNTFSNQRLLSSNNDGDKLGLVYTARNPEDTTELKVLYMETSDGVDFTAPDTIKQGRWPAFSNGACMWKALRSLSTAPKDTLFYSYQLNDTFSTPSIIAVPVGDSSCFAPVGLISESDTVHALVQLALATHQGITKIYYPSIIYIRFRKTSPGSLYIDTIRITTGTAASYYDTSQVAGSLVKLGPTIYTAYDYLNYCYFTTITPPTHSEKNMGVGSQPQVALSEGNIVYSYLASGDTSIIRMCRYVDDTTWFRKDTLFLDDGAEFLYDERGLMYGVQDKDTSLSHLYVYDPMSKEFYLTKTYQGYYPHPYVDNKSSAFSWITAYADKVDSTTTYLHTERQDMNVIIPALYLEAADKRSPYTTFRDTCVHYTSAVVDSGTDSLRYTFPHLDDSKDYAVTVEFYNEADTLDSLQITLGSEVDTIVIPANELSWYEQNIAAGTDTMNLKIARISANGYVPVSRVIIRQRSETGIFMMNGKPLPGPEKIVFCLFQPNPNPFSDAATIRYSLPYETNVSLKVYDISGRLVNTLVQGKVQAGVHTIRWEGKDSINRKCSSGVYFVRFTASDYRASKKMVMLK